MALGDGCWGPGIHWNAENSAAFIGPRAGTWPYSSPCTIGSKNGLLIDQNTSKIYSPKPMGLFPYLTSNTSADTGTNLSPSPYVLAPGGISYTPRIGSLGPGYKNVPYPSCGQAGIMEYDQFTLDVTVGTNSSVSVSGLTTGTGVWEWTNTQNPTAASAHDNYNNFQLNCYAGGAYGWSDEPWGVGYGSSQVPGNPNAGMMLGSFQIPSQASGYITTYSLIPVDTRYSGGFSMSFWFKPIAWADGSPLFSLYNPPNASLIEVQLRQDYPNYFRLHFDNAPVNPTNSYSFNTGVTHNGADTWNFLALVYNPSSGQLTLYSNSSSPSVTMNVPFTPLWGASGLALNSNYSYGRAPAAAYANFRVWNRQLSSAEVATLLTSPAGSGPSVQTSWWPLNDGVSQQRIVRTFTGLWAPYWSNGQPTQEAVDVNLTAAGVNASLINAWTGGLNGLAYSPALLSYAGA